MRARRITAAVLIICIVLAMAGCGAQPQSGSAQTDGAAQEAGGQSTQSETGGKVPDTADAGAGTKQIKGTETAAELLERVVDYINKGADYSVIADVHDPDANVAFYLLDWGILDEDTGWDEAKKIARTMAQGEDAVRQKYPELAGELMEEFGAVDPKEFMTEYLDGLKQAFRNGEIAEDSPNYKRLYAIMTDADKGVDYVMEHYPEILEAQAEHGMTFGLQGALDRLNGIRELEGINEYSDYFVPLKAEFHPEDVYTEAYGLSSYSVATVIRDNTAYYLGMHYEYRDTGYVLVDMHYTLGGVGG